MSEPQSNSPEAERSAQKIRNIFFFIAAANLVIVAIVMWPRPKPDSNISNPSPDPQKSTETLQLPQSGPAKEMETIVNRVISAYSARDAERFAAEFSPSAVPTVDETYFRTVVIGLYHEEFGDILGKKLTGETSLDADRGMLVYEISCKKDVRAKISANFLREGGSLRLVQWRMEKM